jgi:nucleoside-diphosphate-sugar epimerase
VSTCVLFGGSGFIGTHLARRFLENGKFSHIHIADIEPSSLEGTPGVSYSLIDVRRSIPADLTGDKPDWIFNLAAVHREPGHQPHEYYETNVYGADHVCQYAEATDCKNIYFTSSISVYGPTTGPTEETAPKLPTTPYGGSKLPAEIIHRQWQRNGPGRRLIISRPGVVYGPGDPGNILRMIKAIRRGYFAYPGSPGIFKSYAYIYGFCDSVDFFLESNDTTVIYNYVETPTQPLSELVRNIKRYTHSKALVLPVPLGLLLPVANLIQKLSGSKNPIHPVRVRKAATPTHIVPRVLIDRGFVFKYDFLSSLEHWHRVAPQDFKPSHDSSAGSKLRLRRGSEQSKASDQATEVDATESK